MGIEKEKKERTPTIHKKEMKLNKTKLKIALDNNIIDDRGMEYIELFRRVRDKYGLDLSYKGFMSLLSNRATWKLLYAYAIIDVLNINLMDIFDIVDVDVEKTKKIKEAWKQKYQK